MNNQLNVNDDKTLHKSQVITLITHHYHPKQQWLLVTKTHEYMWRKYLRTKCCTTELIMGHNVTRPITTSAYNQYINKHLTRIVLAQ